MRHVVISLHLVIDEFGSSDDVVARDYTWEGKRLIELLAGTDKHVEVAVHNLDEKEVGNGPYSHQGETPDLTPDQVAELVFRKRCPCGDVHLKAGDIEGLCGAVHPKLSEYQCDATIGHRGMHEGGECDLRERWDDRESLGLEDRG